MQSRTRTLAFVAGTAVASLVAGFLVGGQLRSPQQAAAEAQPPAPSAVTVPVDRRELTSRIVTRGDAVFEDAVDVTPEVGGLSVPPVVTGRPPEVGDTLTEGEVLLEVVGRPVIALAGELPTYRTLGPGSHGPDVEQLESALVRLGFDPGDADDARYDAATAAAVEGLYAQAGYAPPQAADEVQSALEAAKDAVDTAHEGVRSSELALAQASGDLPLSQRLAAEAQVDGAQRALAQAQAQAERHQEQVAEATEELAEAKQELAAANQAHAEAMESGDADDQARAASERDAARQRVDALEAQLDELAAEDPDAAVEAARAQLDIARASRDETLAPNDTSLEQAAVTRARQQLDTAKAEVAALQAAAATPAPAAELVFLPDLPRRVDDVVVERGDLLDGPAMQVSGADLLVVATVSTEQRQLLAEGMPVELEHAGDVAEGEVAQLREVGDGHHELTIDPTDLDADVAAAWRGANVKVTIPVASTDGEVLVVPLAALTAGPDGGARVEVDDGADTPRLVAVEVGLTAEGHAEVRATEQDLQEGDLVVVGQ